MSISVLFQFQISITLERAPKKKWIHFKCKVHITVVQWALPQFMVLHSAAENMNQTKKTDWVITHSQSSQNGGGKCVYLFFVFIICRHCARIAYVHEIVKCWWNRKKNKIYRATTCAHGNQTKYNTRKCRYAIRTRRPIDDDTLDVAAISWALHYFNAQRWLSARSHTWSISGI